VTGREQDPWGGLTWSDGEAAPPPPDPDAALTPSAGADPRVTFLEGTMAATTASASPTCAWCATPAEAGATRCATCGAALAQRESIGDLVVPGLTAVDPALKDLDARPLHLGGPSPTQGVASGLVVAAAAGGPIGLAILGGVGAVAAAEYFGAGDASRAGHVNAGETSAAVLQAVERLERGEMLPSASDSTPRPELQATPMPASAGTPPSASASDPAPALHGSQEETIDGQR